MRVSEAIESRRSIRVFKPDAVPEQALEEMIATASRAASNVNLQPWRLYVATGAARQRLSDAIIAAIDAGEHGHAPEYMVHPHPVPEPYGARRIKVGKELYGLLGIPKGDSAGMLRQFKRNYLFFDAPIGMILTIDRRLGHGQRLDCGGFLTSLMLMAREKGLHTCPQAAFATYHRIVRQQLGIPEGETVICGLAVGYADIDEVPNNLVTERAAAADWVTWHRD
jgi:nitroreductase